MKYKREYWTQQEIRGSHFQELVETHLIDVLDFPWGAELHRRRRYPGTKKPPPQMEEKRGGSRQMKYKREFWSQQKVRGSHFQELVETHLMDVLDFPWGEELHRLRRYLSTKLIIAVHSFSAW